ncbi:hypothetical protein [Acinetobacter junii]|uniref:hypothetical protein n=1 Tax=Acinetobacter junii TaxID=40215 RepID=UPI000F69123C|nr:hypothetical protein [Acinetobacter junii]RSE35105.1 hypothetical protein EGT62_03955 [Acinetobacter junii]RSE35113.1 hypothetical protein EGT62_04000 [Acinetobacter junii]
MNKKLIILAAILFYLSVYLFSQNAHASDQGDWWLQRNVTIGDGLNEHRRINVTSRTAYDAPITKDGITKMERLFKNVVVEDVPSKVKVGKPLLQRAKAFKGGLAGVLGGAAISALIEGVGWVMEDGTYIKYKMSEPSNITGCQYGWTSGGTFVSCNKEEASYTVAYNSPYICNRQNCTVYADPSRPLPTQQQYESYFFCAKKNDVLVGCGYNITYDYNPNYKPHTPTPVKITLTDEQVGGIVTGDYDDPVDTSLNIKDQKYNPILTTAYEHDPTGTANELAKEMDDRLKNAPPTSDGKPAPIGDSRYSTAPQSDTTTNDRSWSEETDITGEGTTTPVTDPQTGEPTGQQSISFKFPVFCEWAFKVCDWYDEWKKTDQWMKEEPQLEDKQLEVEQINPINYERQNYVQFGKSCPFSPQQYALPLGIGSIQFEADASVICTYGAIANPYIVALGHLGSLLYLLHALRSGSA